MTADRVVDMVQTVVNSVKTTIELVGSCCTLVAEALFEAAFNIPEQLCEMLYSMYHISA